MSRRVSNTSIAETVRISCCVGTPSAPNVSASDGGRGGGGDGARGAAAGAASENDERHERTYNKIELNVYARVDVGVGGVLGNRSQTNSGMSQLNIHCTVYRLRYLSCRSIAHVVTDRYEQLEVNRRQVYELFGAGEIAIHAKMSTVQSDC